MPDFEIIDVHTHTFASAERGIRWQKGITPDREVERAGTTDELLDCMKRGGISRSVMLMYTPTRFMYEAQIKRVSPLPDDPAKREAVERETKDLMVERMIMNNEWACEEIKKSPQLMAFAGVDPVYMSEEALIAEIEDKVAKGCKGVKIVPLALAIYGNDKRLWPVYDTISRLGVPMLSQAGGGPGETYGKDAWGRPKYFGEALRDFPDLKLILAHMGQGYKEDMIDLCGRFPNLYTDISGQLTDLDQPGGRQSDELVEFIRTCGVEHVMWGTNFPMNNPVLYSELTEKLPLTSEEKELIGSRNAKRVIGIN
jgi:predicted TIM-barrel fold metal-dependent hydrolase